MESWNLPRPYGDISVGFEIMADSLGRGLVVLAELYEAYYAASISSGDGRTVSAYSRLSDYRSAMESPLGRPIVDALAAEDGPYSMRSVMELLRDGGVAPWARNKLLSCESDGDTGLFIHALPRSGYRSGGYLQPVEVATVYVSSEFFNKVDQSDDVVVKSDESLSSVFCYHADSFLDRFAVRFAQALARLTDEAEKFPEFILTDFEAS